MGISSRNSLLLIDFTKSLMIDKGMQKREAIAVAIGEGARLLNFSFHSPSLVPGNTPYVRDASDLARFWSWWDRVLAELDRRGVRSASLNEVIAAAARTEGQQAVG